MKNVIVGFVSTRETKCFMGKNKVFLALKQSVSNQRTLWNTLFQNKWLVETKCSKCFMLTQNCFWGKTTQRTWTTFFFFKNMNDHELFINFYCQSFELSLFFASKAAKPSGSSCLQYNYIFWGGRQHKEQGQLFFKNTNDS